MNASSTMFGPRLRTATPAWAKLCVEIREPDCGSIEVEWLLPDETIVLESKPEFA